MEGGFISNFKTGGRAQEDAEISHLLFSNDSPLFFVEKIMINYCIEVGFIFALRWLQELKANLDNKKLE